MMVSGGSSGGLFQRLRLYCLHRMAPSKLLAEDKDLPAWHPLVTGDPDSVHEAGISAKGFAVSENQMTEWSIMADLGANEE